MKKLFLKVSTLILVLLLGSTTVFAQENENPSDVENLQGTAMNGAARLTWDPATDDKGVSGYVIHYGLTTVSEPGDSYDLNVDVGDVLEYTVTDLENGTPYYFSVVAYDEEGDESLRWATEVSVTPNENAEGGDPDVDAPQVVEATALNTEEVQIEFSEAVVLPAENPQDAFTLENQETFETLNVLDVKMDEEDESEKTIILTTDPQTADVEYQLTAGIDITDKAGNPIISGTSDTALFMGSGEPKPAEDTDGPVLVTVETMDNTHVILNFNEAIVLSIDPSENFNIALKSDPTQTLDILGVELGVNTEGIDDASAVITTSPQTEETYVLTVTGVADEAGNVINLEQNSADFNGIAPPDTGDDDDDDTGDDDDDTGDDDDDTSDDDDDGTIIPPEDVANFLATSFMKAEKYVVKLSWTIPEGNIGKVVAQIIYISKDKGASFNQQTSLDPDVNSYEVENLDPGEYWFKITQKDAEGNETEGQIQKIILSETGPGVAGLAIISLGLGHLYNRRKRK